MASLALEERVAVGSLGEVPAIGVTVTFAEAEISVVSGSR